MRTTNTYSEIAQKWQLRPFMTSCTKDYKGHSLMQTSFTELPNIKWLYSHHQMPLRTTLELFKQQWWGNFWDGGGVHMGFPKHTDTILNLAELTEYETEWGPEHSYRIWAEPRLEWVMLAFKLCQSVARHPNYLLMSCCKERMMTLWTVHSCYAWHFNWRCQNLAERTQK